MNLLQNRKSIAGIALHGAVLSILAVAIAWAVTCGVSLASQPQAPAPDHGGRSPAGSQPVPAAWLGLSGSLRAMVNTPDALQADAAFATLETDAAITAPGVHETDLATPSGDSFYVVAMQPYDGTRAVGRYRLGTWPAPAGNPMYARPAGVIEVTQQNQDTPVSRSFHLRDFLTHDQGTVWPKVLVIRPKLIDKLELISEELDRRGLPSKLHIMSGFRTPQYNALEVRPGGRAKMSRHMYGDASDVFVDANGDGVMDDLNKDGRVTVADARLLFDVAQSVEDRYPELVGGLSAYPATAAHGPFVHVDTRGRRARW